MRIRLTSLPPTSQRSMEGLTSDAARAIQGKNSKRVRQKRACRTQRLTTQHLDDAGADQPDERHFEQVERAIR
jgi:hypothetical protein